MPCINDPMNGMPLRQRRRWPRVMCALLVASVAVNVWGMVHYRLPGPLWRAIQRSRESIQAIPISDTLHFAMPQPELGFPATATKPDAVREWQVRGRDRLRALLGDLSLNRPPIVRK